MKKSEFISALVLVILLTNLSSALDVTQNVTFEVVYLPDIIINEFVVDPQTDWDNQTGINSADEWIELYNNDVIPVDLENFALELIDINQEIEYLSGILQPNSYMVILNPQGSQNNDGQIRLIHSSGLLIDSVSYGSYNDGNIPDNAPDGNSGAIFDECIARIPNAADTGVDEADFTKTKCTFNSANELPFFPINIIDFPALPECAIQTNNIALKAEINGSIDEVILSLNTDGSWQNTTLPESPSGIYNYLIQSANLNSSSLIYWQFIVKDTKGNLTLGGLNSHYINSITELITDPSIPDGLNNWYISEPLFTLTNPDGNISYRWNGNFFDYTSPFGLEGTPNNGNLTGGIIVLKYWSDVCGGESEKNSTFYFDFTPPEIKNFQPSDTLTIYNNFQPAISAYIDEIYQSNSGVNLSSVKMFLDSAEVPAEVETADTLDADVSYVPPAPLSEGIHEVIVQASDKAGHFSQAVWYFSLNTTPQLTLTVHSPNLTISGEKRIPFNISMSEEAETLEYINYADNNPRWRTLCRNCNEYGFSKNKIKTLKEGYNNITFRALSSGMSAEQNTLLFIDSRVPKISRTRPSRSEVTNGSFFEVKYTEDDVQSAMLFWNPNVTLQNCTSGKSQLCSTQINLSGFEGHYIEYYFTISDKINSADSTITRVFVDTISPELTIILPEENKTYWQKAPLNITISEKVTLQYYDELDSSPKWRTLCRNCNEYGFSKAKTKRFTEGSHEVKVRALDKAGNSDEEKVLFFVE